MTAYDSLIAHLRNLQSKKIKKATFDVNWLVQTLGVPTSATITPKIPVASVNMPAKLDVDGGNFSED